MKFNKIPDASVGYEDFISKLRRLPTQGQPDEPHRKGNEIFELKTDALFVWVRPVSRQEVCFVFAIL